jgi:hypothetical protein
MGLPPGEAAPDAAGPAPAAHGLAADVPAATGAPRPDGAAGMESAGAEGAASAEGAAGAEGAGSGGATGEDAGSTAGARGPLLPLARPTTGDARVDDAVARLDDLAGLPPAEHLAVFEYVHERLTEALGDLDVHAAAHAGDQIHGPGAPGG